MSEDDHPNPSALPTLPAVYDALSSDLSRFTSYLEQLQGTLERQDGQQSLVEQFRQGIADAKQADADAEGYIQEAKTKVNDRFFVQVDFYEHVENGIIPTEDVDGIITISPNAQHSSAEKVTYPAKDGWNRPLSHSKYSQGNLHITLSHYTITGRIVGASETQGTVTPVTPSTEYTTSITPQQQQLMRLGFVIKRIDATPATPVPDESALKEEVETRGPEMSAAWTHDQTDSAKRFREAITDIVTHFPPLWNALAPEQQNAALNNARIPLDASTVTISLQKLQLQQKAYSDDAEGVAARQQLQQEGLSNEQIRAHAGNIVAAWEALDAARRA